jgi:hypothetical protein
MLKIKPNPTFFAPVEIPTPDGPVKIKVEFKHRDRDEFAEFIEAEAKLNRADKESLMEIMVGWSGTDAEFSAEAVAEVCKNYHQAGTAIVEAYIETQTQARRKN